MSVPRERARMVARTGGTSGHSVGRCRNVTGVGYAVWMRAIQSRWVSAAKRRRRWLVSTLMFAVAGCSATDSARHAAVSPSSSPSSRPRLVVQITVDQLRADLLYSFAPRFRDGFARLLSQGFVYTAASFGHAATETAPGHATLLTGAPPSGHGIVSGQWWDRQGQRMVYAVEQPGAAVLEEGAASTAGASSRESGRGPANLLLPTTGDEIDRLGQGRAKVLSVAGKDRSAVIGAGHRGQAFWFTGRRFVSSRHYYTRHPEWVDAFNAEEPTNRYRDQVWDLLRPQAAYERADHDARAYEVGYGHLGSTFPHRYAADDPAAFHKGLARSPASDELVVDFVVRALEHEQLGRDEVTDFLAVSLSSTDYVGHYWGPSSLEAEDNLYRVDVLLGRLLQELDERVGLEHTLVVLSADHGAAELPGRWHELGHRDEPLTQERLLSAVEAALQPIDAPVLAYRWPYVYLDHEALRAAGRDTVVAQRQAAHAASRVPGVTAVIATSDLASAASTLDPIVAARVRDNYHPARSGDLHVVNAPFVLPADPYLSTLPTTHGSPWEYDTHVPVAFLGDGIAPGRSWRRIQPRDIAPTISARLGIAAPLGATGEQLDEVRHRD
ncbi:MAG: alkaline phosphatase family protein [Myxococcales bacterium FL481]|nr:MAG: alkaline phosphatase family protein [Myxococcales bacterium FL481]